MKAYIVFDDFPESSLKYLQEAGIQAKVQPLGVDRPGERELKKLIESYDILIVGTGQLMPENIFENVCEPRIIGTASIGIDHIHVPQDKKELIQIVNAPTSNRISVAEHTFALILALEKCLPEAISVAERGLKKREMQYMPSDLFGKTIGVIGAGGTACAVINMAQVFGMKCLCWTRNPHKHTDLKNVKFVALNDLMRFSDIVSVNIPLTSETKGLINNEKISFMESNATFISLSRPEITDNVALFEKAKSNPRFKVGLDLDADAVFGLWNSNMKNVIVTPHIGGGTSQSRIRMFREVSYNIVDAINH